MSRLPLIAIAFAALAGCSGGAGGRPQSTPAAPATTGMTVKLDFTAFTEALLSSRPDSTDPAPVTAGEFTFRDDDNAAAFAAVLAGT